MKESEILDKEILDKKILNSQDYKEKLLETLQLAITDVNSTYYYMREELENEILARKETAEQINEEVISTYFKLNEKVCIKLIKIRLPLRIKLINKIKYRGHGVYKNNKIIIYFSFNSNMYSSFQFVFELCEIKGLLGIK